MLSFLLRRAYLLRQNGWKVWELHKQFDDKIQIIGVSNDDEQKLKYFLQKRPRKLWFASDNAQLIFKRLYHYVFKVNSASGIVALQGKSAV